jgi:formate dehydrogenase iron-sulfur subunit
MTDFIQLYLPCDAAALSMGADEIAEGLVACAQQNNQTISITRTGTRGMLWLEPMLEIDRDGKRYAFGPIRQEDISSLIEGRFSNDHPTALGPTDELSWMKAQTRLLYKHCGINAPLDLAKYESSGGLVGLRKAIALSSDDIIKTVTESGLRGRGGAGFPAGIKWQTAAGAPSDIKYVCCNADEGDSGTFADRILMEGDPSLLIEGMVITGIAIGATKGFIYIRSEYPHAIATMKAAIKTWEDKNYLGTEIFGSKFEFNLEVRRGAGSYICGEESSMLNSLEGKRGVVRAKPPIPALEGLFGKPTIVNNVLTLASVPEIMANGAKAYADLGQGRSLGTQAFQLAGNIKRGGLLECPFGISLRELIETYGGGTLSGRPIKAVQVGGPLGAYISESQLDIEMDYEVMAAAGAMLGHGGIVVFDDTVDMAAQAEFAMEFCVEESCGKCTPCRIGSVRGVETIAKIRRGENVDDNLNLLDDLCTVMTDGSLCAMGGLTPNPVLSAIRNFPDDFKKAPTRSPEKVVG